VDATRRGLIAGAALSGPAVAGAGGHRSIARVPGVCVIAARAGRIVRAECSGLADLEQSVPLTPGAPMRIASLTKQFTAIAVLRLVHDGALGLADTLGRRLPACPALWRPITLRQLLGQVSGLTDDMRPLLANIASDLTVDQLLALYQNLPLAAAPVQTWRYSNLNYWILGKVVEVASGERYADFVERRVLTPGMTATRYGSYAVIIPGRARGYESDGAGGWVNARYFSDTLGYAAGGFVSSPLDMVQWYAALSRGDLVAPGLLSAALTEGRTSDGKGTGYGLGWYISTLDGLTLAHHGGRTFGFQSYLCWVPSRSLVAAVFENVSDARGEPQARAREALRSLASSYAPSNPASA